MHIASVKRLTNAKRITASHKHKRKTTSDSVTRAKELAPHKNKVALTKLVRRRGFPDAFGLEVKHKYCKRA
jgi:hypothetical protein